MLGVFFGRHEEVPHGLHDILDLPGLTTSMLMGIGLKHYDPRWSVMLDMANHLIAVNLQVVANILHSEGHECLCHSPYPDSSEVEMLMTIETFVLEAPWHAGSTKYRRIHCVMSFLEKQLQLLMIPSTNIMFMIKANQKAADAHRCIIQAVQSVTHPPHVILGQWAASILTATTSAFNAQAESGMQAEFDMQAGFDMQAEFGHIEALDETATKKSRADSVGSSNLTMGSSNSIKTSSDEESLRHGLSVDSTLREKGLASVTRDSPPSSNQASRRSRRQGSHARRPNYDTTYHHQLDDVLPAARKRRRMGQQARRQHDPTWTQDLVVITADEWATAAGTCGQ